jgi:hypothetical protein
MDFKRLAQILRMQPTMDSAGYPIDQNRPIVFDKGGLDPHTELSMTATGKELGLPNANAYYNVPTIYGGQMYDPKTFSGMNAIRKNVQQNPNIYPQFQNSNVAVQNAIQRSKDIGQMRQDELNQAIYRQMLEQK